MVIFGAEKWGEDFDLDMVVRLVQISVNSHHHHLTLIHSSLTPNANTEGVDDDGSKRAR